ncbi:glycine betaine/L-proline transport ATP binding subunit [Acididesulfobacillus acetoxydans]|uniref:Quaternary amine transport ATP-binding protein n=1 Tax=Acididesulfobacillus acetoxydans TaxID=1561005 RepID=A0A8S0VW89_9FIRM|nr:glycine betaine/L-proline transport ATP binding subunit [Acididesulfobacillus acetoxydans]CEJ06697.1 Glycine betaine/carnitine/choline transport ATP-binding protein OpuCA [Acididesulfobacillus acetoxydans]
MIELREVTKCYKGQTVPAIEKLSLCIDEGEICVLVGPSGCGKSTTLRLINRMIDLSSGTILINGEDILNKDPDQLRRGIGYVIQQIGLLPHRTIGENIAIVPRLYKWPKGKIKERVNQLLTIIGLDPDQTRNKYPSQLSGGQMQRVGVARAMAVDPPIMLMDEPFGAVDPLVRSHLQDEFLRLQEEIKKTIVFVTHDINEAIKMGDKIAIFNEGRLVQFGTPEQILTDPADDFVENFIGHDRVVRMLSLYRAEEAARKRVCVVRDNELAGLAGELREAGTGVAFIIDAGGGPLGYVTEEESTAVSGPERLKAVAAARRKAFVQANTPLPDALSILLEYDLDWLGVLQGKSLCGALSFKDIQRHVYRREGE